MNGMAGAGLTCGIFALATAVLVPVRLFAVVAVLIGVAAIFFSARGRAVGHVYGQESMIARAGLITGGLAMLVALVVLIVRS